MQIPYNSVLFTALCANSCGAGGGGGRNWRVDVGAAFQLAHNLGGHIETGGTDLGWARRSLLLTSGAVTAEPVMNNT